MKKLILGALLVSTTVMASEVGLKRVSFSVGGRGGWNTTYYNCDSAKETVRDLIEKLGGTSVAVDCTGGLDTWGHMPPMPAYISATFDNPVTGSGQEDIVKVQSRFEPSCELNVTAMEAILPQFENVSVLKKRASCFDNSTRWSYVLKIVR